MNANDPKCGNNFNTQHSVIWYVYVALRCFAKRCPYVNLFHAYMGQFVCFCGVGLSALGLLCVRRLTRN